MVNPLSMLLRGKPFITNYTWEPQRGTRFSLVDRDTGEVSHAHTDEAWFGFHHVNSADRDGKVQLDMIVYPDAELSLVRDSRLECTLLKSISTLRR